MYASVILIRVATWLPPRGNMMITYELHPVHGWIPDKYMKQNAIWGSLVSIYANHKKQQNIMKQKI